MANSAFFYFLNQGILMRFVAAKSLREARKALRREINDAKTEYYILNAPVKKYKLFWRLTVLAS